jgi:hypothetical protein
VFTVAFLFFSAVQYILRAEDADCAWYGSARAWLDLNADGRPNPDEPPLSDVEIHVNDIQNQFMNVSWPVTTNEDGDVRFRVPIPGCVDTLLEISVDIPEGYRITTRPRIEIKPDVWNGLDSEPVYYFGFVPAR